MSSGEVSPRNYSSEDEQDDEVKLKKDEIVATVNDMEQIQKSLSLIENQ